MDFKSFLLQVKGTDYPNPNRPGVHTIDTRRNDSAVQISYHNQPDGLKPPWRMSYNKHLDSCPIAALKPLSPSRSRATMHTQHIIQKQLHILGELDSQACSTRSSAQPSLGFRPNLALSHSSTVSLSSAWVRIQSEASAKNRTSLMKPRMEDTEQVLC